MPTTRNTIILKSYTDVMNEYTATAVAITPGMLIELTSAGTVQAHANAGQNVIPPMFAVENSLIGGGIDDAYAASDKIQCWIPQRGDEVYAILKDDTTAVTIGAALESAGGGYLQLHTADSAGVVEYPNAIVAIALEAMDLSGSSGEESSGTLGYNKRIKVRIV